MNRPLSPWHQFNMSLDLTAYIFLPEKKIPLQKFRNFWSLAALGNWLAKYADGAVDLQAREAKFKRWKVPTR